MEQDSTRNFTGKLSKPTIQIRIHVILGDLVIPNLNHLKPITIVPIYSEEQMFPVGGGPSSPRRTYNHTYHTYRRNRHQVRRPRHRVRRESNRVNRTRASNVVLAPRHVVVPSAPTLQQMASIIDLRDYFGITNQNHYTSNNTLYNKPPMYV